MNGRAEMCTFRLGKLTFGVAVEEIREVLRARPMTIVPLSDPVVAGLMNLRGQIVTALDMRARFGLPPREGRERPLNLVVKMRGGADVVSLIVDDVGDVIEIDEDRLEEAPTTLRGAVRELTTHVYKAEQGLILCLDVAKTVMAEETGDDMEAA